MNRQYLSLAVLLTGVLYLWGPQNAYAATSAPPATAPAVEDLERALTDARRDLDKAAKRLAELHRWKYAKNPKSKKAMLGILLDDKYGADGIQLVGVTPGGGAEAVGMRAGDRIIAIGAMSLTDGEDPMDTLVSYMSNISPGEQVDVIYVRDDEEYQANVVTKARGDHVEALLDLSDMEIDLDLDKWSSFARDMVQIDHKPANMLEVAGDLAAYFDVERGVVLTGVTAGSALKAGDVIMTIGAADIESLSQAHAALKTLRSVEQERVDVVVTRRGKKIRLEVDVDELQSGGEPVTKVIRIKKGMNDGEEVQVEVTD